MKFIKNSIDSERLEDYISEGDLEKQMAKCEVKPEILNGHITDRNKIPEKNIEEVKKTLANGINGKSVTPTNCNGKANGLYEEEEDFNLVLEDSSEGGESPLKKHYEDSLSAPQIVQEIEDLLGINSSSAGIQEELNNLDGAESMEDNLDSVEDIEDNSQEEVQDTCKENDENKKEGCQAVGGEQPENKENMVKSSDEIKEANECDTSHMDLVYDEVEIGMENGDSSTPNESILALKIVNKECKVASKIEAIPDESKYCNESETKDITSKENEVSDSKKHCTNDESDDTPPSQSSGISQNSEEWMVLDSIESSEDDENQNKREVEKGSTNTEPLAQSPKSNDITCEIVPVCDDSKMTNDNKSTSEVDCTQTVSADSEIEHVVEAKDELEVTPSLPLPLCEGDKARKRSASEDDDKVELKKPRLEEQSDVVESSPPVLKRISPLTTENDSKRTKLHSISEDSKLLENENEEDHDSSTKMEDSCESKLEKDNQATDLLLQNTAGKEKKLCKEDIRENVEVNQSGEIPVLDIDISSNVSSKNDDVVSPDTATDQLLDKLIEQECDEIITIDSPSKENTSLEVGEKSRTKDNTLTNPPQIEQPTKSSLISEEVDRNTENKMLNPIEVDGKTVSDENKENVSSCSVDKTKEVGLTFDALPTIPNKIPFKSDLEKINSGFLSQTETKKDESTKPISISKEISSSIRELEEKIAITMGAEKLIAKRDGEKAQGPNVNLKNTQPKKLTNLDFAIERVVEKARIQVEKKVPILKKFHKDQLKKLKRPELEEIVVSKICEAVSYKSELGQMRLRTQNLEETNEMWRKKVHVMEKQNRELEMVLKRFLNEIAVIKRENQNKVPVPIKMTRSVGLQVVLASSMHGALVSSRSKLTNEGTHLHDQLAAKAKQLERDNVKEQVKASTFMPPAQSSSSKGRGRQPKTQPAQNSRPSTPQSLTPKVTPPATPAKPAATTPVKTIQTPNKDLEVIDLTDREERAKALQTPVGGSIRVSPSTQVCFVQQTTTSSPPQQPLYLVQKAGQRPQFLVATSTASPQRPGNNLSRPPPGLALPVFRAGGHLIPVQTSTPVNVKPSNTTPSQTAVPRVPPALRMQSQVTAIKHPAPLPPAPPTATKPGMKAPPPKPQLKIAKTNNGIMLSWSMSLSKEIADMQSYQLYAYQEGNQPPSTGLWKKVGDVKALPLPMACTLTQFIEGHKYHFAVRAVDTYGRIGPFSSPSSILLTK